MINRQGIILKPIFYISRLLLLSSRKHKQFYHSLPQKKFSQEIMMDMRQAEKIYYRGKFSATLNKHLLLCFSKNDNLLDYIINIINYASNRTTCSSSLVFRILQHFSEYVQTENVLICPTLIQKTDILTSLLKFKDQQIIKFACNIFKINAQSHCFKDFVNELVIEQKYIEAALCVSVLNLQDEFDIKEILLPILFEGHMNICSIYLMNKPELQMKTVNLLDEYLNVKSTNIVSGVSGVHPKKCFRILSSFINAFKISPVHCPNLHFIKSKGAIRILIRKRADQSVSETTWEEMLMNIIGENEDLKKHLITKLVYIKDIKTARKMAEKLNVVDSNLFNQEMENDDLENIVDNSLNEDDISSELSKKLDGDSDSLHLKFALRIEDIKLINSEEDFLNCIDDITQNYDIIGIDSEWKPNFGLSRDRLSLIQLAVRDKVFILDVLLLSECLKVEHWDKMFDDIFGNPNIIKLGCGISSDVNMILKCIKGTDGKVIKFSHILDMALFYQKLQEVYPDSLVCEEDKSYTRGLSSLCDIILGKPLNKEERLCDWEKRPLKYSQLEYAALDAHCLICIYDKLKENSIKKNINFEHLTKVALILTASQWKSKKKFKGVKDGKEIHVPSQVPISNLKIVVDLPFENHGKELRQLGADVIILNDDDDDTADSIVQISQSESRIIICSEKLWNQIKDGVKEGFCHHFPEKDIGDIKVYHLLKSLNAHVVAKSIFSRCVGCNSNDGLKLRAEDLKTLNNLQISDISTSINSAIKDNLTLFTSELQDVFNNFLNSHVDIKFSSIEYSPSLNQYGFLCRKCGCIS